MQLRRLQQRGDTIVEVLIAIAVVGMVLGGAYVVVNSNVKNNQRAQEQSRAVKVAESQLEQLRNYAVNNPLPTGNFCLNTSGGTTTKTDFAFTGTLPTTNNNYPVACRQDDGAVTDRYMTGIRAEAGNRFTVYISWDGPTGTRAQVSIAYKVYK